MALAAISVLGIDLSKNVCSIVSLNTSGAVVMRRKVRRETLIALAEKLPPCIVGMEACCGAHPLGARMGRAEGQTEAGGAPCRADGSAERSRIEPANFGRRRSSAMG